MYLVRLSFLLILSSIAGAEPRYLPPDDSYPLLRRDLLPLDTASIHRLATHLTTLGDRPFPKEASELRDQVRLLTLSLRLSPSQLRARIILQSLSEGNQGAPASNKKIVEATKETLEIARYLIKRPSTSEGHLLGQLLLDLLAPLIPNDPILNQRDLDHETTRWQGVIANLSTFKGIPKITSPSIPDDPVEKIQPSNYQKTEITAPLLMMGKGITQRAPNIPILTESILRINEKQAENPEASFLEFRPKTDFDLEPLGLALADFFASSDRPLPSGGILNVHTGKQQYSSINRENIAAPLTLMIDAALTGRPLRSKTLLFARLGSNGELNRPHQAWELMLHLLKTPEYFGSRLIIGQGLEEELEALLTIQNTQFFTQYEVIAAPSFQFARELLYEDGNPPEELTKACITFQEVRDKALEANSLDGFLNLSTVQERLRKSCDQSPQHLSALMLLKQATEPPSSLATAVLAQELNRRLQPIFSLELQAPKKNNKQLKILYRETRDSLRPIEKILRSEQTDFFSEVLLFIQKIDQLNHQEDIEAFHLSKFALKEKLEGLTMEKR